MELIFYCSGFLSILTSILVIITYNPMYALLYLIVSLLSTSCIFFSLGAYFAGAIEVIIYTGAIMVMFMFVIMIININIKSLQILHYSSMRHWIGPLFISISLLITMIYVFAEQYKNIIIINTIAIKDIGIALFGPYILIVEMSSMLLMAGLIIAFHLGSPEKNRIYLLHKYIKLKTITKKNKGN